MKKVLLTLSSLYVIGQSAYAQGVAVNTDNAAPDNSSMLDVKSTTKGMLVPRMTAAQRAAISSPANGLLVYQTDGVAGFYNYNGSAWVQVSGWSVTGNSGTVASTNFIGTTDAIDFVTRTNNAERMRVTSGGNVGIGTSNPTGKLDVTGGQIRLDIGKTLTVNTTDNFTYDSQTMSHYGLGWYSDTWTATGATSWLAGYGGIKFFTFGTERMAISSAGSVGIGTSSPNSKLSVVGRGQFGDNMLTNNDANDDIYLEKNANYTQLHLYNTDGVSTDINAYISENRTGASNGFGNTAAGLNIWTSSAHPIRFGTNATERVSILSSGNVGIGTSSPSEKLDVSGNIRFSGALMPNNTAGTTGQVLTSAGAGAVPTWENPTTGTTETASNGLAKSGNDIRLGGNLTAATTVTNNTFALNIAGSANTTTFASSGSVGIGVSSPTQVLDVNGGILARGNSAVSNQGAYLQWNRSGSLGETWLLNQSGAGAGAMLFGSVTTVNAHTEWARFDGTGKLGIGTASPSEKLDVSGNVRFSGALMPNNLPGSAGQVLTSAGAGAPTWETLTTGTTETASNGLTKSGNDIRLGGNLTAATTVTNNTFALNIAGSANTTTFASSGNVGIGTNTPTQKLDVNGTIIARNGGVFNATTGNDQLLFGFNGTSDYKQAIRTRHNAGAQGDNAIDFYTWNSGVDAVGAVPTLFNMTINGGNVGIGTSAPTQKLDVSGNIRFSGALMPNNLPGSAGQVLTSAGAGAVPTWTTIGGTTETASNGLTKSGNDIRLGGNLTAATTVTNNGFALGIAGSALTTTFASSGNVGIGTTSPSGALHVNGPNGANSWTYLQGNLNGTANPAASANFGLMYGWNSSGGGGESDLVWGTGAGSSPDLHLNTWNGTTKTRRMTITSGGNVGIGTTAPAATLHVNGSVRVGSNVWHTSTDGKNRLYFGNDDRTYFGSAANGYIFRNAADGDIVSITNAGNVGIGTSSPTNPLHIQHSLVGGGIMNSGNGGNSPAYSLADNGVAKGIFGLSNGSGDFIAGSVNGDICLRVEGATNSMLFSTGGTGTSRMAISSSGDVGIGTSSPLAKLDVRGKIKIDLAQTLTINPTDNFTYDSQSMNNYGLGWYNDSWNSFGSTAWMSGWGGLKFFTQSTLRMSIDQNGNARNTTGNWVAFSDARIKTVTNEFTDGLDVIKKIRPVKFKYNANAPFKSNDEQIGIIAQELEKVAPYMVNKEKHENINDLRAVNNQAYTFLLINAVKEQQAQIEALQAENTSLKAKTASFEAKLSEVETLKAEMQQIKMLLQTEASSKK